MDIAVRRLVGHAAAREVLLRIVQAGSGSNFPWVPHRVVCDPDLRRFATSFLQLQEERESADYDHTWDLTKKDAEDAINRAEDALGQLARAKSNAPIQVRAVCIATIADSRNRKRMKLVI